MKFFIDTANLAQIREANEMGVLFGLTIGIIFFLNTPYVQF